MSISTPKGHIPLGEAVSRLGRSLFSGDWTGEEFAPAVATVTGINSDTHDYLIGWVVDRCGGVDNASTQLNRRTLENPDDGRPLSTSTTEQWGRAREVYEEARSLIDEMTQFESIKDGKGHLTKIWTERDIIFEWPEDFPLSKDDLEALKVEEEKFRTPREDAYKRLDKAARLLQQELCGTPPDCEDAMPALWNYPDKTPDRIDLTSWVGPAGLNNLKRAARDDYSAPGLSRTIVPLERIESLCLSLETPIGGINETEAADPTISDGPIEAVEIAVPENESALPRKKSAEPDTSNDAGNQNFESANSRRGNPKWIRGPYYEPLRKCLSSKAKLLEKKGQSLSPWFEGLSRSEFRDAVKPALGGIDLPKDRTLYDAGRRIVTEIENR